MAEAEVTRKLAVVLYADVAGYTRLTDADEEATHRALSASLDAITAVIEGNGGQVLHYAGDAILAEFSSVVVAVACAIEIQRDLAVRNHGLPEDRKLQYRIGVNLGDVIVDRNELYGEGVNIAARLESLADPGGICISRKVLDEVRSRLDVGFEFLGDQAVKNVERPIPVYKVLMDLAHAGQVIGECPALRSKHGPLPLIAAGAVMGLTVVIGVFWLISKAAPPPDALVEKASAQTSISVQAGKPFIAVLPFANMSDDKEQEYFSDGMTEDLITDLSKISALTVISRTSSFAYKGQSPDIRAVAKDLGVTHVVEGSVRKVGNRIRITAQLTDAATGAHIWADRYDRERKDIFALQDEVRSKIVATLAVKLTPEEEKRLARTLSKSPEAYELYLRALQQMSFFNRESNQKSQKLFKQAIELDPDFAAAYAYLAQAYSLAVENNWTDNREELIKRVVATATKGIEIDSELPFAHWSLGRIYSRSYLGNMEQSLTALKKSITLNPNYADGYAMLGSVQIYVGQAEKALGNIEKGMRLNPRFPFWYMHILGQAQFALTRYGAAAESFKKAIARNPTVGWTRRWLVATYGQLGKIVDAEWEMSELESLGQPMTIEAFKRRLSMRNPEYVNRLLEGARKAGVPEK